MQPAPQGGLDICQMGKESSLPQSGLGGLPDETENTSGRSPTDNRVQLSHDYHESRDALANMCLELLRCSDALNVDFTGNTRREEDTDRQHDDELEKRF